MRKAKKVPSAPLKANSLSELRDLQRQASKQAALKQRAGHSPDTVRARPDDRASSAAPTGRRPHRFLPPGAGTGTRASTHKDNSHTRLFNAADDKPASTHADDAAMPTPGLAVPSRSAAPPDTPGNAFEFDREPQYRLDEDDIALFRRVVQSVTPTAKSDRALQRPVPAATPAQLQQRRQHAMGQRVTAALDVSDHYVSPGIDHDDTVFLQTGHGPHLIKGLQKGKWQVQASLDLHGSTLDEARERMDRFLQSCREHQIRCVRIVHGKGHGSKNGDPVLKETVRRWLSQLAVVQAYIECDEANGGAGAVLVLLSKDKP